MRDISRFKQSDYEDFPECFYLDEWKVTFFYNETIRKVVKRHLNHELLNACLVKRRNYASHFLETQMSNDKAKEDILRRMQIDTIEVIGMLSEEEFERKNRVALLNDDFIRRARMGWRSAKRQQIGGKGLWKCDPTRLKMAWHRLADGTRPVMQDCYGPSKFEYYHNTPALEQKIFGHSSSQNPDGTPLKEIDLLLRDNYPWFANTSVEPSQANDLKNLFINTEEEAQKFTDEEVEDNFEDEEEEEPVSPFAIKTTAHTKPKEVTSHFGRPSMNPAGTNQEIVGFFSKTLTSREKVSLKR